MTLRFRSGDMRQPYLQCDAEGCRNQLSGRDSFGLGTHLTPRPTTGWRSVDVEGERRDYCLKHAAQSDR